MVDGPKIGQYDRLARVLAELLDEAALGQLEAMIQISGNITETSGVGRGMINPMRDLGDLIRAGPDGSPQKLIIGTNGQVLTVVSGEPEWASGGGSGLTVSEGGTPLDTDIGTIDFDASDFNLTESPEDEVNIALNYGVGAGQPAEGNHTHAAPTITVEEGDSTVDAAVTNLDFDSSDFNVSSSPAGEANIALNYGSVAGQPAEGDHTHAFAGGGPVPGWQIGRYYSTIELLAGFSASARTQTANTEVCAPVFVPGDFDADRIGVYVSTLQVGSTVRLGIRENGADGWPGTLLLDAGTVNSATTGAKEITISQALEAGWYWLSAASSHAVALIGVNNIAPGWLGETAITTSPNRTGFVIQGLTAGFSALPTTLASPNTQLDAPIVYLRAA